MLVFLFAEVLAKASELLGGQLYIPLDSSQVLLQYTYGVRIVQQTIIFSFKMVSQAWDGSCELAICLAGKIWKEQGLPFLWPAISILHDSYITNLLRAAS